MASRKHRHEDLRVTRGLKGAISQNLNGDLVIRARAERTGRDKDFQLKALKRDKIQAPFRRSGLAVIAVGERWRGREGRE